MGSDHWPCNKAVSKSLPYIWLYNSANEITALRRLSKLIALNGILSIIRKSEP